MEYRHRSAVASTRNNTGAWLWLALIALVAALACKPVRAEQLSLIVNGKAIHLGAGSANYNESNWGGGVQYDFNVTLNNWVPLVTASGFRDSNRNPSYYAGGGSAKRFALGDDYHVDLGGIAFVMTRKGYRDGNPFFGALPVLSVGTERLAVNMTYVPKIDPKAVPLWFFQLKIGLNGLSR
jgi:hypothetical protein